MDSIGFPNLGLFFPHVGQVIRIGSFTIAYYGVIVALGMMAGVSLIMRIAKKTGQDPDIYFNFSLAALAVGIIGARVYYVIFSWDYYKQHLLEIINFRGGGLAIYGGVIAGILTAAVYSGRKHIPLLRLLDTVFPGVALGQAIGRWGNFFNSEAHGGPTDLPWGIMVDGEKVHPTFLYESIWCLLLFILLVFLTKKRKFSGQIVLLYGILYSVERFFVEGLRTDSLMIGPFKQAQVLSASVIIVCVILYALLSKKKAFNESTMNDSIDNDSTYNDLSETSLTIDNSSEIESDTIDSPEVDSHINDLDTIETTKDNLEENK